MLAAEGVSWENLTFGGAMLVAFGVLLKWVLTTLTNKLDALVKSVGELVDNNAKSLDRLCERFERFEERMEARERERAGPR